MSAPPAARAQAQARPHALRGAPPADQVPDVPVPAAAGLRAAPAAQAQARAQAIQARGIPLFLLSKFSKLTNVHKSLDFAL